MRCVEETIASIGGAFPSKLVVGETKSDNVKFLAASKPADRATFRDGFRLDNTGNNHDTNSRI